MLLPHLAAACKRARLQSGFSLAAVAGDLGCHRSSLSRFETGQAGWPNDPDRYVTAYAAAAGVSAASIWVQAIEGMTSAGAGPAG